VIQRQCHHLPVFGISKHLGVRAAVVIEIQDLIAPGIPHISLSGHSLVQGTAGIRKCGPRRLGRG
jgi:hypothetical protein